MVNQIERPRDDILDFNPNIIMESPNRKPGLLHHQTKPLIKEFDNAMKNGDFVRVFSIMDIAICGDEFRSNPFLRPLLNDDGFYAEIPRKYCGYNYTYLPKGNGYDGLVAYIDNNKVELLNYCIDRAIELGNSGAAVVYSNMLLKVDNTPENITRALQVINTYQQTTEPTWNYLGNELYVDKTKIKSIHANKLTIVAGEQEFFKPVMVEYMTAEILSKHVDFGESGFITINSGNKNTEEVVYFLQDIDSELLYTSVAERLDDINSAFFYMKSGKSAMAKSIIQDHAFDSGDLITFNFETLFQEFPIEPFILVGAAKNNHGNVIRPEEKKILLWIMIASDPELNDDLKSLAINEAKVAYHEYLKLDYGIYKVENLLSSDKNVKFARSQNIMNCFVALETLLENNNWDSEIASAFSSYVYRDWLGQ